MEDLQLVGNARALHEVHAAPYLEGIREAREGLFHPFECAADDSVDREGHAPARHLVAEHVYTLEAHLLDDHVEEVDAVRTRLAERETDMRVHEFERDSGESGAAPDIDHAGGPFGNVRVDEGAVGVMAFHHRLERIEARQVLVLIVRAQQLVEFPELRKRRGFKFHAVVMQQLVESLKRGLYALPVKQREFGARSLEVRHEIAAGGTARAGGGTAGPFLGTLMPGIACHSPNLKTS